MAAVNGKEDIKESSSDFVVKDEVKVFSVVTSVAEEALEVETVKVEAVGGVLEEESKSEAEAAEKEENLVTKVTKETLQMLGIANRSTSKMCRRTAERVRHPKIAIRNMFAHLCQSEP